MAKVWIVVCCPLEVYDIYGIYSTEEQAQGRMAHLNDGPAIANGDAGEPVTIHEFELDVDIVPDTSWNLAYVTCDS